MSELKDALEASLGIRQKVVQGADGLTYTLDMDMLPWPDVASMRHVNGPGGRHYESLTGAFPTPLVGVTTFKSILGLGKDALIRWSANEERMATLEAAGVVYAEWAGQGIRTTQEMFVATVEAKIGPARQHQKLMEKAQDIGTIAHAGIQEWLTGKPLPKMRDESLLAVMAFQDWFAQSGLKFVRGEQTVYDLEWGFAGTIDLLLEAPDGVLEVWDLKSSKGLYLDNHIQVAAYTKAARNFANVRAGGLIRVPKVLSDLKIEVRRLGEVYDYDKKRMVQFTEGQLTAAAKAALECWRILKGG